MSVYTPPALDAVDFELQTYTPADITPYESALSAHTPPALDAVDFALSTVTPPTFPNVGWELLPSGGATITGTLAATETQDTASLSGLLVHVGTLAVTESQDSASLTGKVAHTGTLAVTEAQDVAAFAGDVTTGGITITVTLEATESQDLAEFAGTIPSRTQSGGGGNSSVSRPKRLVITMDDKDYVITSDQLQSFLEYAKTQVKEKPVKKKKKKSKTLVLTEPPKITFKSIPPEVIPLVDKQIDRTNEILAEIWRKALIQYLQDIEDEEALMLLLS